MLTRKKLILILLPSLLVTMVVFRNHLAWPRARHSQEVADASAAATSVSRLPGLRKQVTVVRDTSGVPHVTASSDHDAYYMMGYLHAQDRFFQMDVMRKQSGGTGAEMLGAGPGDRLLGNDVLMRTLGLARSAERSLSAYSPETMALIQAYSNGVNAWLDSNALPPEYSRLEITRASRWTPLDSIKVLKLIQLRIAFETTDLRNTVALSRFQESGRVLGYDGTKLFFGDIFTVSPFDRAVTIPQSAEAASTSPRNIRSLNLQLPMIEQARRLEELVSPDVIEAASKFIEQSQNNPFLDRAESGAGSNWWVVSGAKTSTRNAMLANDPHLELVIPANFYEIHLKVNSKSSPMNVHGASNPGIPGVFIGQNESISWGVTTSSLDVTDFFAESLVIENGAPTATRYKGQIEPLVVIPEEFKVNLVGNGIADDMAVVSPGVTPNGLNVPAVTRVVPRRNNGPLIEAVQTQGVSIQYAGDSATRDLEGIFALARARNLTDFKRGLRFLEVGALNWAYADVHGNIATFVNGAVPLREDLNSGIIDGLPPIFIRDGTGTLRNEWIPRSDDGPGINYESLPFDELPQAVNPAQGFLVSANNDPIGVTLDNDPFNQMRGQGIYYISARFDQGLRAAKITQLLNREIESHHGHGKVSFRDMQRIQSNVQMFDAEVFMPYIIQAFNLARSPGAPAQLAALANDPAVSEAVGRLSNWDFSAPTGIAEGYDARDPNCDSQEPSNDEVSNSIAATIYSVWRSRILLNTVGATLQRVGLGSQRPDGGRMLINLRVLLDNFSTNRVVGVSGLDFFVTPGLNAPPEVRRDAIILKSLKDALDLLANNAFFEAFGGSTNQQDYRWGKLHRTTLSHFFSRQDQQFSVPTAGNFVDLSPILPGLAVDGGYETIDNSPFNVLGASSQNYTFAVAPVRRYVGELSCWGVESAQIMPGGESGVLGNRFYADQVGSWLTNDYRPVFFTVHDINRNRFSKTVYKP
jgi:penicillin amidase